MNQYLIAYELRVEDKSTYTGFYDAIKGISGKWWHFLDSVWIVKETELSAKEIADRLSPHLHLQANGGDNFVVIAIDPNFKSGWLPRKAWDWLNNNDLALGDDPRLQA